jgi:putative nucleotidyltransferase with HDIG domain
MSVSMDDIFKQIDYLPVFNKSAQKALQLLMQPDTHNKEIADVLKYDPGLTANVLKLANSAYFCRANEIKDLTSAINYLGRDQMYQILTLTTASKYFKKQSKGYEIIQGELWKHSIATGLIAEQLAQYEPTISRGVLFTAGILHDVGKTILSIWVSDLWNDICYLVDKQGVDFLEAEKKVLGFTHSLVGGAILQRWLFDDDIVQASRHHHDNKIHKNPVVRITKLADYMSITMGYMTSDDSLSYKGYEELMEYYKIQTKQMQTILNDCFNIIQTVLDDFTKLD